MKICYFSDTDTALVEFSGRKIAETKEINENIYIDSPRMRKGGKNILGRCSLVRSIGNLPHRPEEGKC